MSVYAACGLGASLLLWLEDYGRLVICHSMIDIETQYPVWLSHKYCVNKGPVYSSFRA